MSNAAAVAKSRSNMVLIEACCCWHACVCPVILGF